MSTWRRAVGRNLSFRANGSGADVTCDLDKLGADCPFYVGHAPWMPGPCAACAFVCPRGPACTGCVDCRCALGRSCVVCKQSLIACGCGTADAPVPAPIVGVQLRASVDMRDAVRPHAVVVEVRNASTYAYALPVWRGLLTPLAATDDPRVLVADLYKPAGHVWTFHAALRTDERLTARWCVEVLYTTGCGGEGRPYALAGPNFTTLFAAASAANLTP